MDKPDNPTSSQIGGVNLSGNKDSDIRAGNIDASTHAGGHIAGRDVVIYNYHYHGQTETQPTPSPDSAAAEPIPPNPYRGLFAFRPEHADLFFGREQFTTQLVTAVESRRLVTVLGASGSGKSSVVFAGLVPALVNRPGEPWLFTTFRPGDDPFQNLAAALVPLFETSLSKVDQMMATRKLSTGLQTGDLPLTDVLASIQATHPDHRLLLIADQFEELYTLCRDPHTRHAFLDLLITAHSQLIINYSPFTIILTLRADFLGQASLYRPFADALQGTTEILGPMTETELHAAIEKPAALQGITFEAGLVKTLLADVGHEEGSLPLLEFALSELWQHQAKRTLTHTAYVEIGQVEGALSRHADRAYHSLSPAEQQQARRIFVQLVNPGRGTEDTRRLATRNELGQNWDLVARLASERLVVTGSRAGDGDGDRDREGGDKQDTVEVVHEALIRNWGQLRAWMDADREFLTWQLGLRADLTRWEKAKREEAKGADGALLRGAPLAVAQEKLAERPDDLNTAERDFIEVSLAQQKKEEQQRRRLLIGAVVAALVMAVLAVFSLFQWQDANQQRTAAVTAQAQANIDRSTAEAAAATVAAQNEKTQAELRFLQTTDPAERLTELYTFFTQTDTDSRTRARYLFFSLPEVDQLALLQGTDQPEALAAVGRAILPNLADINGIYYTNDHLNALLESVEDAELQTELENWLAAREAAQTEDYDAALARYNDLVANDDQNPALYLERARVKAKLGQAAEALADLSTVIVLAQAPDYSSSGVLPLGPEFATTDQMRTAVQRLILVNEDLMAEYEANAAKYSELPEVARPEVEPDDHGVPMVKVPAGSFKMGSNDGLTNEQPVHRVYLAEYYIDQYEVTNEQFVAFLNEQGNQGEGSVTWYNPEWGQIKDQGGAWQVAANFDKHPVTGVSWYGARAYCAWRGGRLPTEAEWEKAGRGDDERTYPWGEAIAGHLARYYGSSETNGTAPVGHYPEGMSPYGAYDMAGNVWEWTSSLYRDYPYQAGDGREDLDSTDVRVLRGGSWDYGDDGTRASYRNYFLNPDYRSNIVGFRCSR